MYHSVNITLQVLVQVQTIAPPPPLPLSPTLNTTHSATYRQDPRCFQPLEYNVESPFLRFEKTGEVRLPYWRNCTVYHFALLMPTLAKYYETTYCKALTVAINVEGLEVTVGFDEVETA